MIRYGVTMNALTAAIRKKSSDWLKRAAARTSQFRKLKRFEEQSSIWSEVKSVYMELQGGSKCAYCERKLESTELGKVEQDVEHFRPKGNVKAWTPSAQLKALKVKLTPVPAKKGGYYLLPYHLLNYAAACKPCNSAMKSDRFPIAGPYRLTGTNPAKMKVEKPYLIYPIGTIDEDPEKLIDFHGISPRARVKSGHARMRALVTIEFFHLDDVQKRKNLVRERAIIITSLYPQLEKSVDGKTAAERKRASNVVKGFTASTMQHANCARSLTRLFKRSKADAEAVFERALELVASIS